MRFVDQVAEYLKIALAVIYWHDFSVSRSGTEYNRLLFRHQRRFRTLPPIAEWSNFLIAEASASAALTGLVFVAVSINLARVLTTPGVPARAGESIVQLLGVLIVSTFGLIPSQSKTALGVELLATGLTLSAGQIVLQVRALRTYRKTSWILSRVTLGQLSALPFCVAGIFELRQTPGALYWLVPGVIASFIAGVAGAWVVLVEILR